MYITVKKPAVVHARRIVAAAVSSSSDAAARFSTGISSAQHVNIHVLHVNLADALHWKAVVCIAYQFYQYLTRRLNSRLPYLPSTSNCVSGGHLGIQRESPATWT